MEEYQIWKVFTYNGNEVFAYPLPEVCEEEEEVTICVCAAENHCRVESIHVHKEVRRKKCQE